MRTKVLRVLWLSKGKGVCSQQTNGRWKWLWTSQSSWKWLCAWPCPCRTITRESRIGMLEVAQSPKSSGSNLNWHSLSPGKPWNMLQVPEVSATFSDLAGNTHGAPQKPIQQELRRRLSPLWELWSLSRESSFKWCSIWSLDRNPWPMFSGKCKSQATCCNTKETQAKSGELYTAIN